VRFGAFLMALCFLRGVESFNVLPGATVSNSLRHQSNIARSEGTKLHMKIPFFARDKEEKSSNEDGLAITPTGPMDMAVGAKNSPWTEIADEASVLVIGGGVSGLTAAIKAAEGLKKKKPDAKVLLVEADSELGGRVLSETTDDGFVLDKGFAVFIEEYPEAKSVLDYDALKLKPFLPGALVKLSSRNKLARVSDPLRVPADTLNAVLAPVGSLIDKAKVLPLIFNVRTKSISQLFEEKETDTETALIERWGFSDDFIQKFYKPFLEGIYLSPLSKQSSRMFSFVFKMFSEGAATLPAGGMGSVSKQLVEKAKKAGVEIRTDTPISCISVGKDGGFIVDCAKSKKRFTASSLIVATDGQVAQRLLSNVPGFENLVDLPEQPQLTVGCVYYSFKGAAPVEEPILILNGCGDASGTWDYPVNNVCFPSVVNEGYAPEGYNLCSVTVLGDAMKFYEGKPDELDTAVRRQLGSWFREQRSEILSDWDLKKIYFVSAFSMHVVASPSGSLICPLFFRFQMRSHLSTRGHSQQVSTVDVQAILSGERTFLPDYLCVETTWRQPH
jgi:phytoene dehydrogenase-like protein